MRNILHLALLVGITIGAASCKKQTEESSADAKTLTSAQQIFQKYQEDFPKSKSANWQDIARPLPADFTPIWDAAIESSSGGTAFVTVPISTPTKYTAVFPCTELSEHNHDHDHGSVVVVQKLVVYMSGDSSGCYIANIVPFSDCELSSAQINRGFYANSGMAKFTGFAAYHTLKGEMVHIDLYNGGMKQNTLLPNDEQAGPATKYARLYLNDISPITTKAVPSNFNPFQYGYCDICRQPCGSPHNRSVSYDLTSSVGKMYHDKNQSNYTAHCFGCNRLQTSCQCPYPPINPPVWCAIHQTYKHICGCGGGDPKPPTTCHLCNDPACRDDSNQNNLSDAVHRQFLLETLGRGYIPYTELHSMQVTHRDIDRNRIYQEDLHRHNLQDPYENYEVANKRLRDFFMHCCFFGMYADATHPILDTYLTVAERQEKLGFYVYYPMSPIVPRMPSMDDKRNTFLSIFNGIKAVSIEGAHSDITPEEEMAYKAPFGQIYDRWASGQRF